MRFTNKAYDEKHVRRKTHATRLTLSTDELSTNFKQTKKTNRAAEDGEATKKTHDARNANERQRNEVMRKQKIEVRLCTPTSEEI